jgi:hypothetical protein
MMKKSEENPAAGAVRQAMPSPTAPIKELESFSNVELKTNLHSQYKNKGNSRRFQSLNQSVDVAAVTPLQSKPSPSLRDTINVKDIEGAEPRKYYKGEIYNKNRELLSDSVLGRRKHY